MLGLPPKVLANLAEMKITQPTPIQTKAIPHAMNGRDVMGLAQTGTGKTAAFGLPIVSALLRIEGKPDPKSVRGLILAPTRELAKQIVENLQGYSRGTQLRINLVVGGVSINPQVQKLARGTDLLVATPGRLIDLLERKAVRLDKAQFLVLDEADQMLDMGFIHALRQIAPLLPKDRQTMLFSATMPKLMEELSASYLSEPVKIVTAPVGKPADKIDQCLHFIEQADKQARLIEDLAKHPNEAALVFSRTKHGAERIKKHLERAGFDAGSIHGNKSQGQRDRALKGFREGDLMVLVATDVAARGIDIPEVRYVYNFDMPNVPDNYVHRIGRTARAGRDGTAIAYVSAEEMGELKDIQKVMGKSIPVASGEAWEPVKRPARGGGRGKPGGGGGRGARRGGGGGGQKQARPAGAAKPAGNGQKRRRPRRARSGGNRAAS